MPSTCSRLALCLIRHSILVDARALLAKGRELRVVVGENIHQPVMVTPLAVPVCRESLHKLGNILAIEVALRAILFFWIARNHLQHSVTDPVIDVMAGRAHELLQHRSCVDTFIEQCIFFIRETPALFEINIMMQNLMSRVVRKAFTHQYLLYSIR